MMTRHTDVGKLGSTDLRKTVKIHDAEGPVTGRLNDVHHSTDLTVIQDALGNVIREDADPWTDLDISGWTKTVRPSTPCTVTDEEPA